MAAPPRRTPIKPNPRPLPPPGPDDDDDDEILNPFARGGMRRSPMGDLPALPELDIPEPELPPTGEQPDPPTSTPPMGIHSTPSRRPRRSRVLAERLNSSPTKQPPVNPNAEKTTQQKQQDISPTTEKSSPPAFLPSKSVRRLDKPAKRKRPRARLSDVRDIKPLDPDGEANQECDAILAEIAQLKAELDILARENERIRQLHLSKQDITAPENLGDVVDVLLRHLEPRKSSKPQDSTPSWVQAALDPVAFLPFSKPSSTAPTLFPNNITESGPIKAPKSHRPLPIRGDKDLLFLQAFTPLNFTSRITILPRSEDDSGKGPLLQQHTIMATSASSPGLFSARIEMTVDTSTHTITSLSVPSIYPPSAASELAPLLRKIIPESDATSISSALYHNVSILTWAMGSWLRVAIRRAKIWRALDRDFGSAEAVRQTVGRVRATTAKGRGLKRKAGSRNEDDHGEGDSVTNFIDSLVNTDDLLPYLDRMWMDFRIPALGTGHFDGDGDTASLRVQWRIEFDWTGEASSRIRALVSLPGKCKLANHVF